MQAVSSILQALFSTKQHMPCNVGNTRLGLNEIALSDLDRYDYDHDYNSDCIVTACQESDGDSKGEKSQ